MKTWQVVSIPSENNSLTDALGISEKRLDELLDSFREILKNEGPESSSKLLEQLTGMCNNINEACYVSYKLGEFADFLNNSPEEQIMKSIAKKIGEEFNAEVRLIRMPRSKRGDEE